MISRRQFLRGHFGAKADAPASSENAGGKQVAKIIPLCMAISGNVVCRSCGDACPEAAIRFSPRLGGAAWPTILAERCTGCGDCINACPVVAISLTTAAQA